MINNSNLVMFAVCPNSILMRKYPTEGGGTGRVGEGRELGNVRRVMKGRCRCKRASRVAGWSFRSAPFVSNIEVQINSSCVSPTSQLLSLLSKSHLLVMLIHLYFGMKSVTLKFPVKFLAAPGGETADYLFCECEREWAGLSSGEQLLGPIRTLRHRAQEEAWILSIPACQLIKAARLTVCQTSWPYLSVTTRPGQTTNIFQNIIET